MKILPRVFSAMAILALGMGTSTGETEPKGIRPPVRLRCRLRKKLDISVSIHCR